MSSVKTERDEKGTRDVLDKQPLKNGHRVEIRFPDNYILQATVFTTTTTSDESCHNDRWKETHDAAHVRIIVHGVGLKIRLSEHALEVKRVYLG